MDTINSTIATSEQIDNICEIFMKNSQKYYQPGWLCIQLDHRKIPSDFIFTDTSVTTHDGLRGEHTFNVSGRICSYTYGRNVIKSGKIIKPKEKIFSRPFEIIFKFGLKCDDFTLHP